MSIRPLTPSERALLEKILSRSNRAAHYISQLDACLVQPIDTTGSLRFVWKDRKPLAKPHRFIDVKGIFWDVDHVPVLICPFEDDTGRLYELDIQKMGGGDVPQILDIDLVKIEPV